MTKYSREGGAIVLYNVHHISMYFITGLSNGPILFCALASVVCRCCLSSSVTLLAAAVRRARGRSGGRNSTAGQYCYVPLRRHLVFMFIYNFSVGTRYTSQSRPLISLEYATH